jgi:hypothetical protein
VLSISKATAEQSGGKAIDGCPKPEDRPLGLALDATCIEPIGYVPAIRDGPGLAFHGAYVRRAISSAKRPILTLALALPVPISTSR